MDGELEMVPSRVGFFIPQRYFIKGVILSGIKGKCRTLGPSGSIIALVRSA